MPDIVAPEKVLDVAKKIWRGADASRWSSELKNWPDYVENALRVAGEAAEDRFDLLGSGFTCLREQDGSIRWHEDFRSGALFPSDLQGPDVPIRLPIEGSDIKIPWELSRFQHVFSWITTGREDASSHFERQCRDWIRSNPVGKGVNWACPMDVAIRAISWTAAIAAWGNTWDPEFLSSISNSLMAHGLYIRGHLEWAYRHRTNHYFADITGLAVLGAVFSHCSQGLEWLAFARKELDREIQQQFAEDGFNKECSTTYHRLMIEMATISLAAFRAVDQDLSEGACQRLHKAYQALSLLCDDHGNIFLIGDNDSSRIFPALPRPDHAVGHLLSVGSVLFDDPALARFVASPELALIAGFSKFDSYCRVEQPAPKSLSLPKSGFFILGKGDCRVVVRCGPLSYRRTGSHRHMDQLSICLSVDGEVFFTDPGTYCYTAHRGWRRKMAVSSAHNTLEVDGEPQCRVWSRNERGFSCIDEDRASVDRFTTSNKEIFFSGRHRAYRRLKGGGDHCRTILFVPEQEKWTIQDQVALTGAHVVEWNFHLDAGVSVDCDGNTVVFSKNGVQIRLITDDFSPDEREIVGDFVCPSYGIKTESRTLCFKKKTKGSIDVLFSVEVVKSELR